jgi:hypothetical protein
MAKGAQKRLTSALASLRDEQDPMARLDLIRRVRDAEELEAAHVEAARAAGATWSEIGAAYGLTKQGAQQRFRADR